MKIRVNFWSICYNIDQWISSIIPSEKLTQLGDIMIHNPQKIDEKFCIENPLTWFGHVASSGLSCWPCSWIFFHIFRNHRVSHHCVLSYVHSSCLSWRKVFGTRSMNICECWSVSSTYVFWSSWEKWVSCRT